jgi:hypothetical protein
MATLFIRIPYEKVLSHEASAEMYERYVPGDRELLGDLRSVSVADLPQRGEGVEAFLPRMWEVAEAIVTTNPGIQQL